MIRRSNEEWLALYEQQRASGLTMKDWCIANDVKLPTMADRITRLRKLGLIEGPKPAGGRYLSGRQATKKQTTRKQDIVQLSVAGDEPHDAPDTGSAITLRVGGVHMDISDHASPATITAALQALMTIC